MTDVYKNFLERSDYDIAVQSSKKCDGWIKDRENVEQQLDFIQSLEKWLKDFFSGDVDSCFIEDVHIRGGWDAIEYSEYAHRDTPWMSFEGGLYEIMNMYYDYKDFYSALMDFCSSHGRWFEMGHAWNCSFYKND